MTENFTFKKAERLKSRKVIASLFNKGQSFGMYPLRVVWLEMKESKSGFPVQFALTVPKKKFPKAVHRNRLRRLIREAYRLNKHRLYQELQKQEKQYGIMIIYTGKEAFPFQTIESSMKKIIKRLSQTWVRNAL